MKAPFIYFDGVLLIYLLASHFIADFIIQTNASVERKKSGPLWKVALSQHTLWVGLLSSIALIIGNGKIILGASIITVTHALIDVLKVWLTQKRKIQELPLFIADQLIHIAVILIVWLLMIDKWREVLELKNIILHNYPLLLKLLGYLIVIGPVTILIKISTQKWSDDLKDSKDGLEDAGRWIGILERLIILTLIFIEQYTAIGFLVTAKSILRLIDKPETNRTKLVGQDTSSFSPRKHTEYVLIGTFWSFLYTIITGLAIRWLLHF